MADNSFGSLFRFTTFGESHGPAIGCVVDGCPPGLTLSETDLQADLDRRKPGQSRFTTQRREADEVRILSGVFEGRTTGTPIGLLIENTDQRSKDYGEIANSFRPGHADYTYWAKYGFRDYRGGGRSSARETAMRVAAGGVARQVLTQHPALKDLPPIRIRAAVTQIGPHGINRENWDWDQVDQNPFFGPDAEAAATWADYLDGIRKDGLSAGAIIECVELEDSLCDRFGLEFCDVAPDLGEPGMPLRALGQAGADFIRREIERKEHKVIGLGHGRTLSNAVRLMSRMDAGGVQFVSLLGGLTRNFSANPYDVMHRLAEKTAASAFVMPVPFFANSSEDREVLLAQRGGQLERDGLDVVPGDLPLEVGLEEHAPDLPRRDPLALHVDHEVGEEEEQADEDGELEQHRQTPPKRVYALFFVKFHRLATPALIVVFILLSQCRNLGLNLLHFRR